MVPPFVRAGTGAKRGSLREPRRRFPCICDTASSQPLARGQHLSAVAFRTSHRTPVARHTLAPNCAIRLRRSAACGRLSGKCRSPSTLARRGLRRFRGGYAATARRSGGDAMTLRLVCCVGIALAGCSRDSGDVAERKVFRAWSPVVGDPSRLQARSVGEDCTASGRAGCGEGVCLHLEPHANRGYFCSARCERNRDCPESWSCTPMVPADPVSYCVPPRGWASRSVARSGAVDGHRPPVLTAPSLRSAGDGGAP